MTATAITGARVRVRTFAVSADALALATLGIAFAATTALTWQTWGDPGRDTGYDLVAAARVAHGDLPYADFTYYYGPLAPALLGAAMWIGGDGVGPAVVVGLAVTCAIVALTYWLARGFVAPLGASLAAALVLGVAFAPTNFSYVLPHTSAMTLGMAALLAALVALVHRRPGIAGICVGLVLLTKPELAAAALAATAAWCVGHRPARAELARLAGAVAALPLMVYGALLTQVSAGTLVFDNLYPRAVLGAGGNRLLELHAPLTAGSLLHHGERIALYGCGTIALLVLARALVHASIAIRVLAFACAASLAGVALLDLERTRWALQAAYGWLPGGALLAACVLLARRRRSADALALCVALAVAGGTTYAAFYLVSTRAQPAVYFAPLAAVFLVALHLRVVARTHAAALAGAAWLSFLVVTGLALAVHDARLETATLRGPGGSIRIAPTDADGYARTLATVARTTRSGEPVLFAPQLSMLSVLADRTSPLPQLTLLPGALATPTAERAAIARLDAAGVEVVVLDRHPFTEYGHGRFGASFDTTLARWVERTFTRAGTYPGPDHTLDVWRRKS